MFKKKTNLIYHTLKIYLQLIYFYMYFTATIADTSTVTITI